MGTISEMSIVYRAAKDNDWKKMIEYYEDNSEKLQFPVTVTRDTCFHLAVHSKKKQPLGRLLEIYQEAFYEELPMVKDVYWNTPLHECTAVGNVEALRLLVSPNADHVEKDTNSSSSSSSSSSASFSSSSPAERRERRRLLWATNKYGETPMFRAVSFGRTKMVQLLKEAEEKLLKEAEAEVQLLMEVRERLSMEVIDKLMEVEDEAQKKLMDVENKLMEAEAEVKLLKEEKLKVAEAEAEAKVKLLKEAKVKVKLLKEAKAKVKVKLLKEEKLKVAEAEAKVKLLKEIEEKLSKEAEAEVKLSKEVEAQATGDKVYDGIPAHHRSRTDTTPLLHVAIQGEHFETALMLLKWDDSIADMKTEDGITALHLLANKPSAFKSGCPMGLIKRILYHCLPVEDEDADPSRSMKGSDDTERSQSGTANTQPSSSVEDEDADPSMSMEGSDDMERGQYGTSNTQPSFLFWLLRYLVEDEDTDPSEYTNESNDVAGILTTMKNIFHNTCGYIIKGIIRHRKNIYLKTCGYLVKGWPKIKEVSEEKKKNTFAVKLAKLLIKKDTSWDQVVHKVDPSAVRLDTRPIKEVKDEHSVTTENEGKLNEINEEELSPLISEKSKNTHYIETPLFVAAKYGIIEIVRETLNQHPAAVEHVNDKWQSILHIAIMYRRKEIYKLLTGVNMTLRRLKNGVDIDGYSLLHQVANVEHYIEGTRPTPALQLQEELQWFERVKKIVPPYYAMLREKKEKKTAEELFQATHEKQLKDAGDWVKNTAQSWSTVATLIATVVFAAAYTVPGGYDSSKGIPILKDSPVFLLFTIMDVIALASSLTSVMTFLSVLTSPFKLKEFYSSIPNKLIWGSTLLFFSVVTTMLSFGSTILLTIQTGKKWTTSFISIAAFLPVLVFALLQINLYIAFMATVKDFFLLFWEGFPFVHLADTTN